MRLIYALLLSFGYAIAPVCFLGWIGLVEPVSAQSDSSQPVADLFRQANDLVTATRSPEAVPLLHRILYRTSRSTPPDTFELHAARLLSYVYSLTGMPDSAVFYGHRALAAARRQKQLETVALLYLNLAVIQSDQGRFPQALEIYFQVLQTLDSLPRSHRPRALAYLNLGTLYLRVGDTAAGKSYTRRSIDLFEKCRCDSVSLAQAYYNLADEVGDAAQRVQLIHKARRLAQLTGDAVMELTAGIRLAQAAREAGDLSAARVLLDSCEALRPRIDWIYSLGLLDLAWAEYYLALQQTATLIAHARRALEFMQKLGQIEGVRDAHELLYLADSLRGDFRSALTHYRRFRDLQDSLRSETKARDLGRLEAQYEARQEAKIREMQLAAERRFTYWLLGSVAAVLLLISLLSLLLLRKRNRERRAAAELARLNRQLEGQRIEIESINAELRSTLDESQFQEKRLSEQHEKVEDSLRYASRIQQAILPASRFRQTFLPPHFIYYQPRDIISGDFYWMARTEGKTLFAVVDCTGHGVPGAFMSVMGHNLLNQIVNEMGIDRPSTVLKSLDSRIVRTLGMDSSLDSMNGMDVCLVVIHDADAEGNRVVEYAGAGRPLWVWSAGELTEYKSARYPCGGGQHVNKTFPAIRLELGKGTRLYLFTDGITDQFGGQLTPWGRYAKLGRTRLRLFLQETACLSLAEQQAAFIQFFTDWMGNLKQLDDVLLACIEL